ncbi:MAG: aminopeptidase P family protein [Proteobacteria bacterium]|nr:aminopeptidase P family protein [Pseudomonadota bacterium]
MDERLQRTVEALRESGADWAVLSGVDSIAYALGYVPAIETGVSSFSAGPTLAIIGRDGAAGLLGVPSETAMPREGTIILYNDYGASHAQPASACYRRSLADLRRVLGVGDGRIAFEPATHPAIADAELGAATIDLTPAFRRQRMTKTAAEITALRRSAGVAAIGQTRMMEAIQPGLTELELFAKIRGAMEGAAGARIAVGGDLLSGVARTAGMSGWPTDRIIETGDAVISDLAPRIDGYWGDSCTTIVLGTPTLPQARLFAAARHALDHAIAEIRPGMTASAVHRMIRGVVQSAGFDYPHHTGHSIGTAPHEHPRLCDGEQTVLRPGMVLMVEPGAYDPAIGGARTEWMLHLTETGCVPLAPFPLRVAVSA